MQTEVRPGVIQCSGIMVPPGQVPISVAAVTGLPSGEARASPRALFHLLAILSCLLSELVARCSLPPPQGPLLLHQGGFTNPIPFKSLNLMIIIHVSLYSSYWIGIFMYHYILGALGILEHATISQGVGNTATRTYGYVTTMSLLGLFLINKKAKDFTRRKVVGWWEEQVLAIRYIWAEAASIQPEASQPETSQPETNQTVTSQPETNQIETNQTETNQTETNRTETSQTETSQSNANQPEANQPNANHPEVNQSGASQPGASLWSSSAQKPKIIHVQPVHKGL